MALALVRGVVDGSHHRRSDYIKSDKTMKIVIVKSGQSLLDIALQEKGSLEAIEEIAALNGLSVTEELSAGMELELPARSWNKLVEKYCKDNDVSPATSLTDDNLHDMWKGGIGFMVVGVDFEIA